MSAQASWRGGSGMWRDRLAVRLVDFVLRRVATRDYHDFFAKIVQKGLAADRAQMQANTPRSPVLSKTKAGPPCLGDADGDK